MLTSVADHRQDGKPGLAPFGQVVSARGAEVGVISFDGGPSDVGQRATVGTFVEIGAGDRRLLGVVTEILSGEGRSSGAAATKLKIDLMGEFMLDGALHNHFRRGVTAYPAIGDMVALVDRIGLKTIFDPEGTALSNIGRLAADESVRVSLDIDNMLARHFAIVGSTGVGKSSGVVLIINEVLRARPTMRVFLLDIHNEYGRSFGDRAEILNGETTRIPFWLFSFEEFVDVLFGGRAPVDEEVDILLELIPVAKAHYQTLRSGTSTNLRKLEARPSGLTVDTPTPYQLQDLIGLIDDRMGKLESRATRLHFHRLLGRIDAIRNDSRYAFMFEGVNVGGDAMADIIAKLFRLDGGPRTMTVLQVAGFPPEATEALVSVLCRLAFDFGLWSEGASPLLFVCEEAHRFVPADRSVGFAPTRRGLLRIAKEGRKYGVHLGLVTQRPAELDATAISQCNTIFALRLPNDRDQAIVRSTVSDSVGDLTAFLPSLGTREVVGFGDGMAMPARFQFNALGADQIPRGEAFASRFVDRGADAERALLRSVIDRWRGATTASPRADDPAAARPDPQPAQTYQDSLASRVEQVRAQLMRR